MFNNTIKKEAATNVNQILVAIEHQVSVNCVLPKPASGSTLYKAGTPIQIDLTNLNTEAKLANATVAMNAVLLHDVETSEGKNNGTALIFGFVNLNRVDTATQALITTALTNEDITKQVTFLKV